MMPMPICDSIVSARLLVNSSGATISSSANSAPDDQAARRSSGLNVRWQCGACVHVSPPACPSRPLGRKIRISTRNRYGRIGATCAIVSLKQRVADEVWRDRQMPSAAQRAEQRVVERHREGLDHADQQRGHEGAGQRAHAADHDHHEDDRADRRRHRRLGDEGVAADHAGQPGQRRAAAEHQHEDARHVVAQRLDHLRVGQRAWITRPMRVRVSSSQSATSITSATSIMKPRVAGNCEQTT